MQPALTLQDSAIRTSTYIERQISWISRRRNDSDRSQLLVIWLCHYDM